MSIFGYCLAEYTVRTYHRRDQISSQGRALLHKTSFRCFVFAIIVAFLGIYARCVYRIPELTGGWRSELMQEEVEFIVLEGVMIVLSVLVLTVFHPGYCFPVLGNTISRKEKIPQAKSMDEQSDVEMMPYRA